MGDEVKPCPFCGGRDIMFTKHVNNDYSDYIHHPTNDIFMFIWSMCCYDCGATFPNRYRKELLIEHWNRRAKEDE